MDHFYLENGNFILKRLKADSLHKTLGHRTMLESVENFNNFRIKHLWEVLLPVGHFQLQWKY